MTSWKLTVQKPDGTDGWTTVAVFGSTTESPKWGKYLSGETAGDAAMHVLDYWWPSSVHDEARRNLYVLKLEAYDAEQRQGTAEYRVIVEKYARYSYDQIDPDAAPAVFTVGALRRGRVRTAAADLVAARTRLEELRAEVKKAAEQARLAAYWLEKAVGVAASSGVAEVDIKRDKRIPRPRKNKTSTTSTGKAS